MDQLQLDLQNNKIHLQEVLVALQATPDNTDLLELKTSLEEAIELTNQLILAEKGDKLIEETWKVNDQCMARCSTDRLYYKAKIIQFLPNDIVAVSFTDYDRMDTCPIDKLKPVSIQIEKPKANNTKRKHDDFVKKQEKKLVKKQKLQEKNALLEKQCEKEANQWQNFQKKINKQHKTKKSIFASPENIEGRVGIGTCGTSGKAMTKYSVNHSHLMKKSV